VKNGTNAMKNEIFAAKRALITTVLTNAAVGPKKRSTKTESTCNTITNNSEE